MRDPWRRNRTWCPCGVLGNHAFVYIHTTTLRYLLCPPSSALPPSSPCLYPLLLLLVSVSLTQTFQFPPLLSHSSHSSISQFFPFSWFSILDPFFFFPIFRFFNFSLTIFRSVDFTLLVSLLFSFLFEFNLIVNLIAFDFSHFLFALRCNFCQFFPFVSLHFYCFPLSVYFPLVFFLLSSPLLFKLFSRG